MKVTTLLIGRKNKRQFSYVSIVIGINLLLFSLGISVASATNYYVSPSGNDGNNGLTLENSWATPYHASRTVMAGDTVFIVDGTYMEDDAKIKPANSGNATHPIIYKAYSGNPILDGNWTVQKIIHLTDEYMYGDIGGNVSYIIIDGLTVKNQAEAAGGGGGIFIGGWNHDIVIKNSTFIWGSIEVARGAYNITFDNISAQYAFWNIVNLAGDISNVTIKNSHIYDACCHNLIDIKSGGIISLYPSGIAAYKIYIENNVLDNTTSDNGIYIPGYHNGTVPNNFYIRNNIINNIKQSGIYIDGLQDSLIENNTIGKNVGTPINILGKDTQLYSPIRTNRNLTFRKNTVLTNVQSGSMSLYSGKFENNSFPFTRVVNWKSAGIDKQGNVTIINPQLSTYVLRSDYSNITLSYSNGTIIKAVKQIGSNNYIFTSIYYPIGANSTFTVPIAKEYTTLKITAYPITALPASGQATVTVNSFDTSLTKASIIVDFTASTTDGNEVIFSISSLSPGRTYILKRGGDIFMTRTADPSGMIKFSNSDWPAGNFTIEKIPSMSGYVGHVNQTPLAGVNVTLFYQNGTPTGQSTLSGEDGKFYFINVAGGSYYVEVSRQGYESKNSSVFTVTTDTDEDIGAVSVVRFDINGDGETNILDMNTIGQHFGENAGQPSPEYDVNGDGVVDQKDYLIVAMHAMELILTRIDL